MQALREILASKKAALSRMIEEPAAELAKRCTGIWPDAEAMDEILAANLAHLPFCDLSYIVDVEGRQLSSNVGPHNIESAWRGQDLSARPYLQGTLPFRGFVLSQAYVSERTLRPCITAVQAVNRAGSLLGFLVADFNITELPITGKGGESGERWHQFRGDPAIRGTLFLQHRAESAMDERLDEVIAVVERLIHEHGVFHCKLHFSSSRATLWLTEDPFRYRLFHVNELMDPALFAQYPKRPYAGAARIPRQRIRAILSQFKLLRFADETIYLRSGSLNIINGLVGLTFSCDGSHYMPAEEFLDRDPTFWFGVSPAAAS